MNFTSGKQLLDICSEKNISISQAMFLRETTYLEQDSVEVTQKMERAYDIMKQSIHRALNEDLIGMGLSLIHIYMFFFYYIIEYFHVFC